VLLGAAVYLLFRSDNLMVFRWVQLVGLSDAVYHARASCQSFTFPSAILYSLPDGCWTFAATSWMILIWNRMNAWVLLPIVLSLAGEFGQLAGVVVGTFDWFDVLFYLFGFIIPGILLCKRKPSTHYSPSL
jgi:hypothetical protein